MTSPSSSAPAASKRRSSSSSSARATAAAKAIGCSRRAAGTRRSTTPAARRSTSMSAATRRSMPGRSTFTATSRPSVVLARWAWAREAAATVSSKLSNRLSNGRPSAASTSRRAASAGNGASLSFSRPRSAANADPKMSPRVERNWPSLMATGPMPSRATARRSPGRPARAWRPLNVRNILASVRTLGGRALSASRGASASARTRVHAAPTSRAVELSADTPLRSPNPGVGRTRHHPRP